MKFTVRKLNSEDYNSILVPWWKDQRWTAPPKDFLPEDGAGGFIVYEETIPVCAGYMYVTNSKVGWCDWIISNFEYKDKLKREEALVFLISVLTNTLKMSGCKYSYALLKSKSLTKHYEENGYIESGTYNKEMIKVL